MHLVIAPPTSGLARQRMIKVGNWNSGSNFPLRQVTGWASDSGAPSTVADSKLVVQGSGDVTITALIDSQTDDSGVAGALKLTHNETIIATGNLTNYQNRTVVTITAQVTVAEGDTIWLQTRTGSAIAAKVYAGSTIEVAST